MLANIEKRRCGRCKTFFSVKSLASGIAYCYWCDIRIILIITIKNSYMNNIKKLFLSALLILGTTVVNAVPAMKSWKKMNLSDGTAVEVTLVGDEYAHYYITRDGRTLAPRADGKLAPVSAVQIADMAFQRQAAMANARQRLSFARQAKAAPASKGRNTLCRLPSIDDKTIFRGSKKAPVILAYFSDKKFSKSDEQIVKFYDNVLNKEGFNEYGAAGSVHDYFKDMSRGVFDLTFDIIGPVKVSKSATYYGGPSVIMGGTDHIGEFITEAVKNADAAYNIDWSKYDWDGDGEVEQVFVLYAGYGQATGGPTGTIWPNAWTLDEATANNDSNGGFSLDGVFINQYACSNELYQSSGSTPMGLGVFCHEFSHCMGLPDMYDTNYSNTPTMGDWDLLASGSYNGPNGIGWCPAGWTSYERAYAGWLDIEELKAGDIITGMKDLEDYEGKAYAIYNDNHRDEFYLLENHKNRGWDAYTPEGGLLVIHVDYDKALFDNNIVNSKGTFTPAQGYDGIYTNDHPRMAPFSKIRSVTNETYYYTYPMEAPRGVLDSLTNVSKPAATLYNALADGSTLMGKPIYNIKKDAETGDISFSFMTKDTGAETAVSEIPYTEDSLSAEDNVYDLTGKLVGKRTGSLKPGIYIIGNKDRTRKIIVR